jgi:hypothetical protein
MHPILGDTRRFLTYIALWLFAGGIAAALQSFTTDAPWGASLLLALPLSLVYGVSALSAYYVCRALPYARRSPGLTVAVFGSASLVSALIWTLVAELWNSAGLGLGFDSGLIAMSSGQWLIFFVVCAGLYLLSLLAHDGLIAFANMQQALRREGESRLAASEAELQMLRTQVSPHFLFNSLNSICALTQFDPDAASAMTMDLAQFFRLTLSLAERERIPLDEEISLAERYLAIEKRRFAEKLDYRFRIAPDAASCLLPPMLLQPLVENAVKHGIRDLDEAGCVEIEAQLRDGWLHIAVSNPVAARASGAEGNGLGLANIRKRLATVYRERARLAWQSEKDRFRVEITVPVETKSER